MSLFEFTSDRVDVPKNIAAIKEFKTILEKKDSDMWMSYIFHLCDWSSPYAVYDNEERSKKVSDEIIDGKKIPKYVDNAIEKYKELTQTDSLLLLESARKSVRKLKDYFDEADPNMEEDPNKAAKDLMMNLKNVGDIINKLKDWEEIIKKEKEHSKIRKQIETNKYNE